MRIEGQIQANEQRWYSAVLPCLATDIGARRMIYENAVWLCLAHGFGSAHLAVAAATPRAILASTVLNYVCVFTGRSQIVEAALLFV